MKFDIQKSVDLENDFPIFNDDKSFAADHHPDKDSEMSNGREDTRTRNREEEIK